LAIRLPGDQKPIKRKAKPAAGPQALPRYRISSLIATRLVISHARRAAFSACGDRLVGRSGQRSEWLSIASIPWGDA